VSTAIVNASKINNDQIKSHEEISGDLYNFGNRICSSGLENILKDSTSFNIVEEGQLPELEKFDKIVLSLQDHLRPAVNEFLSFWTTRLPPEKTLIPSIGINAFNGQVPPKLNEDFTVFLREVSKYSKIGCRGKHTQTALRSLGIKNTIVIGCPSVFNKTINPVDEIVDKQGLMTAGGIPLLGGKKLTYLCQGDFDTPITAGLEKRLRMQKSYLDGYINYEKKSVFGRSEFKLTDALEKLRKVKVQSVIKPYEYTEALLKEVNQFHGFVGARVHSSVLSLLSGIPAVNLNFDLRAIELCGELSIPNGFTLPVQHDVKSYQQHFVDHGADIVEAFLYERERNFKLFRAEYQGQLDIVDQLSTF
jgi:hypothetical protein